MWLQLKQHANRINGILLTITEERRMYFRDAYSSHFVFEQQTKNEITHPQTIELGQETGIIVILRPQR
jgi:DNA mismatch repair protein MutS2